MSTIWAFDSTKNKHSLCRGEDCNKKFCISLREHAADVINFEKKKVLPLIRKELKSHQDATLCCVCRKKLTQKRGKDKIIEKLDFIVILQVNTEVCTKHL